MQNKVCAKCGAAVAADAKFCTTCGSSEFAAAPAAPVQAAAPVAAPAKKPFPTWAKVLIIIGIIILIPVACTVGCTGLLFGAADSAINELEETGDDIFNTDETTPSEDGTYGLGETFKFDDLEITLGKDISFTSVDNQYSDYYGKTVVKVPITVKNLKSETHSLSSIWVDVFGANGTEVTSVGYYFDDNYDSAGELRTGASYSKYMYFLYDADGTYAIEFDNWSTQITVEFEVTK